MERERGGARLRRAREPEARMLRYRGGGRARKCVVLGGPGAHAAHCRPSSASLSRPDSTDAVVQGASEAQGAARTLAACMSAGHSPLDAAAAAQISKHTHRPRRRAQWGRTPVPGAALWGCAGPGGAPPWAGLGRPVVARRERAVRNWLLKKKIQGRAGGDAHCDAPGSATLDAPAWREAWWLAGHALTSGG
jgi:hypothetical protein